MIIIIRNFYQSREDSRLIKVLKQAAVVVYTIKPQQNN